MPKAGACGPGGVVRARATAASEFVVPHNTVPRRPSSAARSNRARLWLDSSTHVGVARWTHRGTAAPNLPALDRNGREPPNCAVATRSTPPPPSRWWSLPATCQPSVDVSRGSGVHHNRCAATARCRNTTWRRLPAARAKARTRRQRLSSLLAASPALSSGRARRGTPTCLYLDLIHGKDTHVKGIYVSNKCQFDHSANTPPQLESTICCSRWVHFDLAACIVPPFC